MSEIKTKRSTFTDEMNKIHRNKDGNIVCCGGMMKMTCHMDGKDFYSNVYECECGNVISAKIKRSKEDMMLWEDDE